MTTEFGETTYQTPGGVSVSCTTAPFDPAVLADLTRQVEAVPGGVLSSGMEYPGRYSRWHVAYVDPPVEITASGRTITVTARNDRGLVLLPVLAGALRRAGEVTESESSASVTVEDPGGVFAEEERSRRPSVFTALREIIADLAGPDANLGLYGALGYDLTFQFEPLRLRHPRPAGQRDLVLHLPDRIWVLDRKRETAVCYSYEFATAAGSTADRPRPVLAPPVDRGADEPVSDGELPAGPVPGAYADVVVEARERFAAGDLFEVTPSHVFHARCGSPAAFFERLRQRNPAPYEFIFNLGAAEYLVGASPEMYVRVTGDRVETCPIAGTIARGADPIGDAAAIRELLDSPKEESELTMCTDVDRNDKSRICVPGSIKVIGRRQIELYSRLIHTVDHIEGRLRPGFDALDAFLTHMWAVTVTGAPKAWAMQFIEDHESGPRRWYGGAVGMIGFDGGMNTGLTLRTAHIQDGIAAVRAGATLLFDSDPQSEEQETRLKARALLETLAEAGLPAAADSAVVDSAGAAGAGVAGSGAAARPGAGMSVLIVDCQDSFVHTLAGYLRELGATVTTLRAGFDPGLLDEYAPDLVVLSPGPGRPADFGCDKLLDALDERGLPAFGVCLGLQAMVEHAGGSLSLLEIPVHGKPSQVSVLGGDLLAGLPAEFAAGRYHSLHARPEQVTGGFAVTAVTADGVVMAIEDPERGRWAVQFHPESILTASGRAGYQVLANVLARGRGGGALGGGGGGGRPPRPPRQPLGLPDAGGELLQCAAQHAVRVGHVVARPGLPGQRQRRGGAGARRLAALPAEPVQLVADAAARVSAQGLGPREGVAGAPAVVLVEGQERPGAPLGEDVVVPGLAGGGALGDQDGVRAPQAGRVLRGVEGEAGRRPRGGPGRVRAGSGRAARGRCGGGRRGGGHHGQPR
jgi:anthranilate synthase